MDIGYNGGSQRLLELNKSFSLLVEQILVIDGVQSATVGFDLLHLEEVALDNALPMENIFHVSFFQSALSTLCDKVTPAQAILGVTDEFATVRNLFNVS